MRREIKVMHHLSGHPHVVTFKGAYEDASHVHIVMVGRLLWIACWLLDCWLLPAGLLTFPGLLFARCLQQDMHTCTCSKANAPFPAAPQELCTGGELFEHIAAKGHYRERDAAHLMRTLLMVVEHCHEMNVVHRDLKVCMQNVGFGCPACVLLCNQPLKHAETPTHSPRTFCSASRAAATSRPSTLGCQRSSRSVGRVGWVVSILPATIATQQQPVDNTIQQPRRNTPIPHPPRPTPGGPGAARPGGVPLLHGPRGAQAQLRQGGRHLVVRRHHVHPAVRVAALLRVVDAADIPRRAARRARPGLAAVGHRLRRRQGLRAPHVGARPQAARDGERGAAARVDARQRRGAVGARPAARDPHAHEEVCGAQPAEEGGAAGGLGRFACCLRGRVLSATQQLSHGLPSITTAGHCHQPAPRGDRGHPRNVYRDGQRRQRHHQLRGAEGG